MNHHPIRFGTKPGTITLGPGLVLDTEVLTYVELPMEALVDLIDEDITYLRVQMPPRAHVIWSAPGPVFSAEWLGGPARRGPTRTGWEKP